MAASSSPSGTSERVKGFDGLRAISALLVFVEHQVRDLGTGAIGVWVFFCLSGYLIVGILRRARGELETSPAASLRGALLGFWRNRALRILPIYYVVVVVLFATGVAQERDALAYYLAYVQNFYIAFVSHQWSHVTHFWSLAIEQQFYVVAAPVLLAVAARSYERMLAGVLVAGVAFTVAAEIARWDPMAVSLLPPANFAFIALGGIACVAAPFSTASRLFRSGLAVALAGAAFALAFALTRPAYDPLGGTPLGVYLSGLVFAGLLVGWTARHPSSRLVGWLELAPLRWLGTISYGFYVYHPFVPGRDLVASLAGFAWVTAIPRPAWVLVQLFVALAVAHASWCWLERPFLRLKRRAPAQGTILTRSIET